MSDLTRGNAADHDQYAARTSATDADPSAAPQEDPVGATGEVVGDRLDDRHEGQDNLLGDETPAAPVDEPGTPTPSPGPGGSTP